MPFCFSPWTNLDISPQGTLSPCCKFQLDKYNQTYNVQTNSVDDYLQSEFLHQLKQQFQLGQWPLGCERCQIEEQNGIASKRNLDAQRWQQHYHDVDFDSSQFITASVAFGNTCNLKCITCNSYSSSKWHQEYKEVYGQDVRPVHFYRDDFVDQLTTSAPSLIHLDIPGGEPMLSGVPEQKRLLRHYIKSGRAKHITLHYTTNATVFPEQDWLDLWKQFQEVDIQLSIDGTGCRYEYIRHPADWSTVLANIDKYQTLQSNEHNVRLSVSHTVSAYNVFYIPEFLDWSESQALPKPWLGRTHRPEHMRPEVWPSQARLIIKTKLAQHHSLISQTWARVLDNDQSQYFSDFIRYTKAHDLIRNLNFDSTFPELLGLIRKSNIL